jgi:hypothetical protein
MIWRKFRQLAYQVGENLLSRSGLKLEASKNLAVLAGL